MSTEGFAESVLSKRLVKNGFLLPDQILAARLVSKLGLPLACANLQLESGGGHNIFGHDVDGLGKCPGWGWGAVTHSNYLAFRHLRQATGRSNGVGPCQLTSPSLQDEADAAGGCWIPAHNMAVGFHYLHDLILRFGVLDGCIAYNGSGPAADAYGERLVALAQHYKAIGLGTVIGVLR